jgi:hypothetical protein
MARIRSIKPEFWADRKLARCASRDARLLYIALWNIADEHARLNGDPVWIKGQVFPYEDDIDAAVVAKLLDELASPELGAVVGYEAGGDPYLFLPKLARHQRLEPAKVDSRLPAPRAPRQASPTSEQDQSESRANESARGADSSDPDADESSLLYVAGSREQVAGSREQVGDAQARAELFALEADEASTSRKAKASPADDPLFVEFYAAYPLRKARGDAERAWAKATREGADPQALIEAATLYAKQRAGQDPKFTKHPATWLNQKCWLDETAPATAARVGHQSYRNPEDDSVYEEPI